MKLTSLTTRHARRRRRQQPLELAGGVEAAEPASEDEHVSRPSREATQVMSSAKRSGATFPPEIVTPTRSPRASTRPASSAASAHAPLGSATVLQPLEQEAHRGDDLRVARHGDRADEPLDDRERQLARDRQLLAVGDRARHRDPHALAGLAASGACRRPPRARRRSRACPARAPRPRSRSRRSARRRRRTRAAGRAARPARAARARPSPARPSRAGRRRGGPGRGRARRPARRAAPRGRSA